MDSLWKSIALADGLIALADEGIEKCADDGCLVLYGVIRDCGYKIRGGAERELKRHMTEGTRGGGHASAT